MKTCVSWRAGLGARCCRLRRRRSSAAITQTIAGTRLDINATGEVTRVPDVAVISAGVVSRAPTATAALQETADRDGAGSRRAEAGRHRRPRHSDDQRQPQSRISLSREPVAAADRLHRLEPGHGRASATSAAAARSSTRWSPKAPTRSAGRTWSSTSPKRRSTRRARWPSPTAVRGPTLCPVARAASGAGRRGQRKRRLLRAAAGRRRRCR